MADDNKHNKNEPPQELKTLQELLVAHGFQVVAREVLSIQELHPGVYLIDIKMEVNMGDTFNNQNSNVQGQGRNQTNIDSVQQASIAQTQDINLGALVPELEKVREALVAAAKTLEQQMALGLVASAQQAALQGDKTKFWGIMKELGAGAGKWVAETALKLGCKALAGLLLGTPIL